MKDWKYYNHALISITPPHIEPDLSCLKNNCFWKSTGGKHPLFARWTSHFDCGYPTEWWYCIKDTPLDLSKLQAKKRYEINKGLKNFSVKIIRPIDYIQELWNVCTESFADYPMEYKPKLNFNAFENDLISWNCNKNIKLFAVFDRISNEICGYAICEEYEEYVKFDVLKCNPDFNKKGVNAAAVYEVCNYYFNRKNNQKFRYLCDGERNIRHSTNFQQYLIRNFEFRKSYCYLHIEYHFIVEIVLKILYPYRKMLFHLADKIKNKLYYNVACTLKQEAIRRSFKKFHDYHNNIKGI